MPVPGSEVPEMIVESEPTPEAMGPFTGTISVPEGSGVPGCDETNECFIPADVSVSVGDTVTWSNDDTAAHTVTSGNPADGPDGKFDSSLFMAGTTFEHTFDEAGTYDYFCMVHPWMKGKVQVN
jgi:plastocyanin